MAKMTKKQLEERLAVLLAEHDKLVQDNKQLNAEIVKLKAHRPTTKPTQSDKSEVASLRAQVNRLTRELQAK